MNQAQNNYKNQTVSEVPLPEHFTMDNGTKINAELRESVSSLHLQLTSSLKGSK